MNLTIALAKPDHGVRGGFEEVVDRLATHLEGRGHRLRRIEPRVADLRRAPFGLEVPDHVWSRHPEFFRYVSLVEAFGTRRAEVADADLVLSTQPGSFALGHDRHLSVFYHHTRVFYDLAELWVDAGFMDAGLHAAAVDEVRRVDAPLLDQVGEFLVGSQDVASRLEQFNDITDRVTVFAAGASIEPTGDAPSGGSRHGALCVSRHEWPKRTELVVQALHLAGRPGTLVGDGGRLRFAKWLDARFETEDPSSMAVSDLWQNRGEAPSGALPRSSSSPVTFAGRVTDRRLAQLYRGATCLVAPAHREDYGLTALEAMHHGLPVIVCEDGGGLTDFVEHDVTGLVVAPTGAALAAAIEHLDAHPEQARRMGEAGRERARTVTWPAALHVLDEAIERIMS